MLHYKCEKDTVGIERQAERLIFETGAGRTEKSYPSPLAAHQALWDWVRDHLKTFAPDRADVLTRSQRSIRSAAEELERAVNELTQDDEADEACAGLALLEAFDAFANIPVLCVWEDLDSKVRLELNEREPERSHLSIQLSRQYVDSELHPCRTTLSFSIEWTEDDQGDDWDLEHGCSLEEAVVEFPWWEDVLGRQAKNVWMGEVSVHELEAHEDEFILDAAGDSLGRTPLKKS